MGMRGNRVDAQTPVASTLLVRGFFEASATLCRALGESLVDPWQQFNNFRIPTILTLSHTSIGF